jgi:hypothetical protein
MRAVFLGIVAVMLGLLTGFVIVGLGEIASHMIFPLPPGVEMDPHKPETFEAVLKAMPFGALAAVVLSWTLGTFAGAWVAAKLAPVSKMAFGLTIGGGFVLTTLATLLMIPHPVWMWVTGLGLPLPAAYLGAWLAKPRKPRVLPET